MPQQSASRGCCAEPISQTACTAAGGTWHVVQPFSVQYATPAPQCVTAPVTRDNHLGNDRTGNEVTANLTIPSNAGGIGNDAAQSCVIRLRYNITTADSARDTSLRPARSTRARVPQPHADGTRTRVAHVMNVLCGSACVLHSVVDHGGYLRRGRRFLVGVVC